MIKRKLYVGGFFCLLFLCTTKHLASQKLIEIPRIQQTTQKINNILELDRIVSIDPTGEYLLGNINRIILYKDKLIILDKRSTAIFVIDAYTGKVITHINRKGRGPGESISICDIAFDDKMEEILVFNDSQKLLYFSLDGRFLKEDEKVDKLYANIVYDNGNVLFYNAGEGYHCFPYSVAIYNIENTSWRKIGNDKKVEFHIRGLGPLMVKSKQIWFTPVLDLGLHTLSGNTIKTPYKLDPKNRMTDALRRKALSDSRSFHREAEERGITFRIQSIRETSKSFVFNTNSHGFMLLDKNILKFRAVGWMEDEYLGITLRNFFAHDGDDNRIMFVVSPEEWLMMRKPYNGSSMPDHVKTQIEMLNSKIKEDSNNFLIFYKEK